MKKKKLIKRATEYSVNSTKPAGAGAHKEYKHVKEKLERRNVGG